MSKKYEDIYKRLNDLETANASDKQKLSNILDIVKEFTADFKTHDEREMAKYDKYDSHLQEVNKTLQTVVSSMDTLKIGHKEQDKKHSEHKTALDTHKEDTAEEFKAVNSKLNKGIGAIMAVLAVIGLVVFMYNYMSDIQAKEEERYQEKIKKAENKNEKMEEKINKLESYTNRNYGYLKAQSKESRID